MKKIELVNELVKGTKGNCMVYKDINEEQKAEFKNNRNAFLKSIQDKKVLKSDVEKAYKVLSDDNSFDGRLEAMKIINELFIEKVTFKQGQKVIARNSANRLKIGEIVNILENGYRVMFPNLMTCDFEADCISEIKDDIATTENIIRLYNENIMLSWIA